MWLGPYRIVLQQRLSAFTWRGWWAFARLPLDFCCHLTDLAFWALDIHSPTTIEAEGPRWTRNVRHRISLCAMNIPRAFSPAGEIDLVLRCHAASITFRRVNYGVLFVGDKGMLLKLRTPCAAAEKDFAGFTPPRRRFQFHRHHAEWIHAIKTKGRRRVISNTARMTEAGYWETSLIARVKNRVGRSQHAR